MKKKLTSLLLASSFIYAGTLHAEDLNEIFGRVTKYAQEKNYAKAMDELSWARKELEKMHQTRLGELLPAEVAGFKGEQVQFASMMGFSNIEREYKAGEKEIKLAISGSAGGEGLGGLAGLAKMGMMMGGAQPGVDQFRIDGQTASLNTEAPQPELTVFLDSGSMLTLSGVSGVDGPSLKKFAEALKLSDLDSYLKGSKS